MTLTVENFEALSDVLKAYDLTIDSFTLTDAPSTTAVRPPVAPDDWLGDLVDGAPVAAPRAANGELPLGVLKYSRASQNGRNAVPAGVYLAVLANNVVQLVAANRIPIESPVARPLVTGRAKMYLTRSGVVFRTGDLEVVAKHGPLDLITAAERAAMIAQIDDLVDTLVIRQLVQRDNIDSSGALAGVDRDARFVAAPARKPPLVYGEPLGVISILPGPAVRMYAAPFDASRGEAFASRQIQESMTAVPEGRYLLMLDLPGQVRLVPADGAGDPILVGDESVPMVDGFAVGCFNFLGHNVGC